MKPKPKKQAKKCKACEAPQPKATIAVYAMDGSGRNREFVRDKTGAFVPPKDWVPFPDWMRRAAARKPAPSPAKPQTTNAPPEPSLSEIQGWLRRIKSEVMLVELRIDEYLSRLRNRGGK